MVGHITNSRTIGVEDMSITPAVRSTAGVSISGPALAHHRVVRRVRHQARDVALLMVFSAACSVAIAVALMLLATVGR
jgi:hypothetical protein